MKYEDQTPIQKKTRHHPGTPQAAAKRRELVEQAADRWMPRNFHVGGSSFLGVGTLFCGFKGTPTKNNILRGPIAKNMAQQMVGFSLLISL